MNISALVVIGLVCPFLLYLEALKYEKNSIIQKSPLNYKKYKKELSKYYSYKLK